MTGGENAMRPAERKRRILYSIIENYIKTGEPVGSKTLQSCEFSDVSSATIRNDMADLTESGFLVQPYTSAGRIPSETALRLYIEQLADGGIPLRIKLYIDEELGEFSGSPEDILKQAERVLTKIIGCVSISTTPPAPDIRIHKIKLVSIGKYTALVVLVTSVGMINTKLFRSEYILTAEILQVFEKALNQKLAGVSIVEITASFAQGLAASMGELALLLPPCISAVMESSEASRQVNVGITGAENILHMPDLDIFSARNLFVFLNKKEELQELLFKRRHGIQVYFGGQEELPHMTGASVLCTRYMLNSHSAGALALIGTNRMDYSVAVPALKYAAEVVGMMINESIDS